METHIVPVVRQWKHVVNAESACRVITPTDNGMLPLVILPNGGTAAFCTNSCEVHVETDGLFEIVPFEHAPQSADQTYNPISANAQSGKAVAQAISAGSTVESFPDSPPPYTLKQGATVQLTEYTDTLELTPSPLTTAQEMRVLYSPAEARTTPLIAVPQGVTLHWAGDAEPTWEVGKDYVIQLLQTAPTHLEARLFNVPQGAKLPDWVNAASYVAWGSDTAGKRIPVAANVDKQLNGDYQFSLGSTAQNIGAELSAVLADATFAAERTASWQFGYVKGTIYLPNATFAKVTTANNMFQATENVVLPRATFASLADNASNFNNVAQNFYMPRATFASNVRLVSWFTGNAKKFIYMNAFNTTTSVTAGFDSSGDDSEFHFYSWNITKFIWDVTGTYFLPSATWNALANCNNFKNKRRIYCPRLNLQAATSASNFWRGHGGISLEELRQVVYGPKLVDGKPAATTYTDENGIVQMIAPPEHKRTDAVYTPLVGEPLYTYDWGDHLYEYIEGERMTANGNKKTGWGIQDFRVTDAATGEFVLDGAGDYTYKSTGHTIAFDVPAAAEGNADYEACYSELEARGWDVLITNV